MEVHPGSRGEDYKAVKASDGLLYHLGEDDKDLLNSLVQMNKKLTAFVRFHRNSNNPYVKEVLKLVEQRDSNKVSFLCGAVSSEKYSHAFGDKFIFMKKVWGVGKGDWDCGGGNYDQCFGIVLHEIAHMVCFSPNMMQTQPSCLIHGSGFCRAQAALHVAAREAGLWKTKDSVWERRLPKMMVANYAGDSMPACDAL